MFHTRRTRVNLPHCVKCQVLCNVRLGRFRQSTRLVDNSAERHESSTRNTQPDIVIRMCVGASILILIFISYAYAICDKNEGILHYLFSIINVILLSLIKCDVNRTGVYTLVTLED